MWPFQPKFEELTPVELRDQLIAAASGPRRKLRAICNHYREQIVANVGLLCKAPDDLPKTNAAFERYVQSLGMVAQFLAAECDTPHLWEQLCGTPEDNPLIRWDQWYGELSDRMNRFEHEALIVEAEEFIEQAGHLQGVAARQNEVFLHGRLGELLFHSGQVRASSRPFETALEMCRKMNDVEGELVYLNNLLEVDRYVGDSKAAVERCQALLAVLQRHGSPTDAVHRQLKLLQQGEPLCRVVCVRGQQEWEVQNLKEIEEGAYQFQFRRNRISLQKCLGLVERGNAAAAEGNVGDAMIDYEEATDVDPFDPDPRYQNAMCLLELGAYAKAKETFDEVERLAPGWFQCRFFAWLAEQLDDGDATDEQFRLLRLLDSAGILTPQQAVAAAVKAVEQHPRFAPFYLTLGDQLRQRDEDAATEAYRKGLELTTEPDLESRLRCALAVCLPVDAPERTSLLERVIELRGNLVSQATAVVLQNCDG